MSAAIAEALRASASRISSVASLASLPVGAATVYYATSTITFPEGSIRPLLGLVGILIVALSTFTARRYNRQLRTLKRIGLPGVPLNEENLGKVAAEAFGTPDMVFKLNSVTWVGSVAFAVLGLKLWVPALAPASMVRMAVAGLVFFPVGAVLAYLLTAQQTRKLIASLPAAGLAPERLSAVLPQSPVRIRSRLLVFTAVLVIVPSAVIADLAMTLLHRGLERVQAQTDPVLQAALAQQSVDAAIRVIAILGSAAALFALLTAWVGGSAIAGPLRALAREAKRMQEGDLTHRTVVPAEDELWDVSVAFSSVQVQLVRGLSELRRAGLQMASTSQQLRQMALSHVGGAAKQAGALHQTSFTTEALARVSEEIAESARGVTTRAEQTVSAGREGEAQSTAFQAAMNKLGSDNLKIAEAVTELERRVILIRGLVSFIGSVAERADLLALNADLEGTKAGDAGRGFSLVAGEMRRLGEEVTKSTRQIHGLIEEVREATVLALRATETGKKTTRTGVELARRVSEVLARIVTLAEDTVRAAGAISVATEQQQTGSVQLADAMASVLAVTQDNQRGSATLEGSTADLSTLANELKEAVQRFQVPNR